MNEWIRKSIPAISLSILFLLDGLLVSYFNDAFHTRVGYTAPRLVVVGLIVWALYVSGRHIFVLTLIFGCLYDSFYTGFLGIYLAAFCLVAYLVHQIKTHILLNVALFSVLGVLLLTLLELMVFSVYHTINLTYVSYEYFFANHLGGTLMFNGVLLVVMYVVMERWVVHNGKQKGVTQ